MLPMKDISEAAQILWNYHVLSMKVYKSDCILALGNSDIRTAEKAAELFMAGMGNHLITTGGFGRLTEKIFDKPEAQIFADVAVERGVPKEAILIEDESTNTFDNLRFTRQHLEQRAIVSESFIVVTKPYMERRAAAMFAKIWPDKKVVVSSPNLDFDDYPNENISRELTINMIVGDLQRIMIYGERGDIVKQNIPETVQAAYDYLVENGYNQQFIDVEKLPSPA